MAFTSHDTDNLPHVGSKSGKPPTTKQLLYIESLAAERGFSPGLKGYDIIRILSGISPSDPSVNFILQDASDTIRKLLEMPKKPSAKALDALDALDNLGHHDIIMSADGSVRTIPHPIDLSGIRFCALHGNTQHTREGVCIQCTRDAQILNQSPNLTTIPDSIRAQQTDIGATALTMNTNQFIRSEIQSQLAHFKNSLMAQVHDACRQACERFIDKEGKATIQAATNTVANLFAPENLTPLIIPIVTETIKQTAQSTILSLMGSVGNNPNPNGISAPYIVQDNEVTNLPAITPNGIAPPSIDPHFYFDPQASRAVLGALKLRKNFYIQGHTGCGKTQLVMQLHATLRRPIERINMDGDVTKRDFIGNMDLQRAADGAQEIIYRYGILPRAMMGGYTLLCDEFSKAPAHIVAVLHPVMEGMKTLYLPDTGETIHAKEGFLIAATDNTGGKGDVSGQYMGAEVQNTASLDRFGVMIRMDYPPSDKEAEILESKYPSVNPTNIVQLVNLATHIRDAFARQELSATLSTRKLCDLLDLISEGFTLNEALDLTFINWLDDDGEKNLITTFTDRLDIKGDE